MALTLSDLLSLFQTTLDDFIQTLIDIKNEGHTLTLFVICGIILVLTVQFIRYVWKSLFESQPIEDLLHFRAAPAGERAAVISIQGQRKYMEDTYQAIPHLEGHDDWSYYGVYDGHGGARCSVYVAHYLHKHVLAWVDAYIAHYSSNSQKLMKELFEKNISIIDENAKNINEKDETTQNIDTKPLIKHKQKGIPACIMKIMNEILLKSHRKADQEFLQLANRQRWKDGSTSVSCVLVPAKDLIASLINGNNTENPSATATATGEGGATNGKIKATPNDKMNLNVVCNEHDRWMFVANTGDSRGILVSNDGQITEMSHDHKPNDIAERNRIQSDGGRVVFFGTWRVEGVLAVSRSFGDRLLKRWIIPDPDVIAHKINQSNDLFLILATDGVWDTVSNQEAARCAIECWNNPQQSALSLNQRLRAIAQKITSFAYTRGSMDNITTLVVHLPSHCS
eukprot:30548_1